MSRLVDPPRRARPGRWARLTMSLAMSLVVVPLLTVGIAAPAAAQYGPDGDTPPFIAVDRLTCPDDIAIGGALDQRCEPTDESGLILDGIGTYEDEAFSNLEAGTYTMTDPDLGDDRVSLVTCNAGLTPGFGGAPAIPLDYDETTHAVTLDLTTPNVVGGLSAWCHWFDLPAGTADGLPAGLIVFDEAGNFAEGTATDRDLSLSGDALAEPIALDTSNPNGVPQGPIVSGPFLVPAGDYTLADATTGFALDLTLAPGQVSTPDETTDGRGLVTGDGTAFSYGGPRLEGAYRDLDSDLYGDTAVALYGAGSGYDSGTLVFPAATRDPEGEVTVSLLGLDDELAGKAPITVAVNGEVVYDGPSTFPAWDPAATGNQWGDLTVAVPSGLLTDAGNELTITNLAEGGEVGTPPWVMITEVTVTT